MSDVLITIGKKIRTAREAKNMIRKDLTAKAQLSDSYLANLETDQIKEPSLEKLQRIASVLGMDWQELLKETSCEKVLLERQRVAAFVWCRNHLCPKVERDFLQSDCCFPRTDHGNEPFLHEDGYNDRGEALVRVISYPSFPAYNEQGEQNRYCPACGHKLSGECEKCGREIDGHHTYCTGCGAFLWPLQNEPNFNDPSIKVQPFLLEFPAAPEAKTAAQSIDGANDDDVPL